MAIKRIHISGAMVVVVAIFASACASADVAVTNQGEPNPTSHDYCEEVIMHLDEFDSAVWRNYVDDEFEGSSGAVFAAKKAAGLVKRAENQGEVFVDMSLSSQARRACGIAPRRALV